MHIALWGLLNCHLRDCRHGGSLFQDRLRKSASPACRRPVARWVPRHFLQYCVIRHKPASEDTYVSRVHTALAGANEPYSHRGRVLADCSQASRPPVSTGSLPDHRPRELSRNF